MTSRLEPTIVNAPGPVSGLGVGYVSSCAVLTNGELACWGTVAAVQPPSLTPVIIRLPGPTRDVTATVSVGCALVDTAGPDTVWCWGSNAGENAVGNGTTLGTVSTPVMIALDAGAQAITAGQNHVCALLDDGSVSCWGRNDHGQLGNGAPGVNAAAPVRVALDGGVRTVSAEGALTCAQRLDGRGVCWGENRQRSIASTAQDEPAPVDHWLVLEPVSRVAAGSFHGYFALLDGGLDCTGNATGGCAAGLAIAPSRRRIPTVAAPTLIETGESFACARDSNGVWCWGSGDDGRTGTGVDGGLVVPARPLGL